MAPVASVRRVLGSLLPALAPVRPALALAVVLALVLARAPAPAGARSLAAPQQQAAAQAQGMELVAHHNLGGGGYNADVWVHHHKIGSHRHVAYVGQFGSPISCPSGDAAGGVKVVDVTDPQRPRLLSRLRHPVGSTAEDVHVLHYRTGPFAGRDIAMVGLQECSAGHFSSPPPLPSIALVPRGLQLYDVTDPANPVTLGFLPTSADDEGGHGLHELSAFQRPDGVFALLAALHGGHRTSSIESGGAEQLLGVGGPTPDVGGHLQIADVTDPRAPRYVGGWSNTDTDPEKGNPEEVRQGRPLPCLPGLFGHSVSANGAGTRAYLSHWDQGTVVLDISTPAKPRYLGRTTHAYFDAEGKQVAEGNGHSAVLSADGRFLFQTDEDFTPHAQDCAAGDPRGTTVEEGWGYLRVFSLSDPRRPAQVATFKTANARTVRGFDGVNYTALYSAHNPWVVGTKLYLSWYSDGVRVLDVADPTAPREVAFFVPPPAADLTLFWPNAPLVWGVVTDERGCVYLSDINGGLYIVREVPGTACTGS